MLNLNEAQEIVRLKIMMNPLNRNKIREACNVLMTTKIEKHLEHDGQPLLGTISGLIRKEGGLTMEERVQLEVAMYMEALNEYEKEP